MIHILKKSNGQKGFTLIELSIVLVIIGLVIGGVLVGQDLIKATEVRAQIGQIEKYNTSVNTFRLKYGYLPGNIPDPYASQFGFQARSGNLIGNGNGIVQGNLSGYLWGWVQCGEPLVFWEDLSVAVLIDGGFNSFSASTNCGPSGTINTTNISAYLPRAKLGAGLYVYLANGTNNGGVTGNPIINNYNFFMVSQATAIGAFQNQITGGNGISVISAYNIDKKIDDGLPLSGTVLSMAENADSATGGIWWSNHDYPVQNFSLMPSRNNITGSSTTCYDNSGSSTNQVIYSVSQNSGTGLNCGLSFKFQ